MAATPRGFLTASERAVNIPRIGFSVQRAVSAHFLSHFQLTAFFPPSSPPPLPTSPPEPRQRETGMQDLIVKLINLDSTNPAFEIIR